MSDEKKKPPKPTAKTSTVPLKKETVRITLRAKPGTGTGAQPTAPPPSPGSAPPPPAAPSSAPPAPAAGAPAPPAAPKAPGAPAPPAAPKPAGGAPTAPVAPGSKTVPLRPANAPTAPGTPTGQPTAKLASASPPSGPGTKPLPKATMQLAPTQPMAARPTASVATGATPAPSQLMEDDEEEGAGLMPFAIAALILGIAVLGVELISSQKYLPSALPEQDNPYHRETTTGKWSKAFSVPKIPKPAS